MEPLRLSPTIKCPAAAHTLTQGFMIKYKHAEWYSSSFYARVNIHNDNLWILIRALLQPFPHAVAMTISVNEENFYATGVVDRLTLVNELHPFHGELCQDAELEMSFLFMTPDSTEMLQVTKGKSIEYWSMDEALFRQTMAAFGIPELASLQQVDKFDFEVKTLVSLVPLATHTSDLMEHIMEVSRCICLD